MSFPSEGQTTYNLSPAEASPGQIGDLEDYSIESFVASAVVNPGRAVQLSADGKSCNQVSQTSSSTTTPPNKVLGVAVLKTARAPADAGFSYTGTPQQYQIGEMVPVMKRGKVFVEWSSTTAQPVGTNVGLNIYSSSTASTGTNNGKFTANTASDTGGSEILPVPGGMRLKPPARTTSGNIALLEINLPGSSA